MPFKACAPRALPPDVAPPLWESRGSFPSAARQPGSGRQAPPAGVPGASEAPENAAEQGRRVAPEHGSCPPSDPQVWTIRGGRGGARPPLQPPNPRGAQSRRFVIWPRGCCAERLGRGQPPVSLLQGEPGHPGSPKLSSEEGLDVLFGSMHLPPQTHTHTHAGTNTNTPDFSSPLLFRLLYVCLLTTRTPQVPRAPPFVLRKMTLRYGTSNNSNDN